jgi:hypothetical protein
MKYIQMDLVSFEAYKNDNNGTIRIQTMKDFYSKFHWIFVIHTKTAKEITNNIFKVFEKWNYPQILHIDNGGKFIILVEIHQFEEYRIEVHHRAAKRPQTQRIIEFVHKVIETEIIKYLMENNTNH